MILVVRLNKFRNFLFAPECECGCGGKGTLLLDDVQELFAFMNDMLIDYDCEQSAIFAHAYDDSMYAAIKNFDEEGNVDVKFFGIKETDMEFFAEWDGELRFCCYGLMIESKPGEWDIVEG